MPKAGISFWKCDAGLNGPAAPRAQKHDLAVLLLLREAVREQQLLPFSHRDAQQQQRSIRIHVQRVRFLVKRFLVRSVAVHVYGDIERPSPGAPPVGDFGCILAGRLRRKIFRLNDVRVF